MNKVFARHSVNLDPSALRTYFDLWRQGDLAGGTNVMRFEKAFGEFIGASAAVAASSARGAFYLTLRAMDIGRGHEVIMPAYTFPSMPAAVAAVGATPVFVDVDPETFNIDPRLVESAVTPRTKAIVAAHLFGQAADVESLSKIAADAGCRLLEDAAHAAGAVFHGKRLGAWGDAAVFSFGIGKNMPCFGGGMVTFKDRELGGKVRKLVNSFSAPDELSVHKRFWSSLPAWVLTNRHVFPWTLYVAARVLDTVGSDVLDRAMEEPTAETTHFSLRSVGRMSNLQATVGLDQLPLLGARNAILARNGAYLAAQLEGIPLVQAPRAIEGEEHIYLYFRILVPERDRFRSLLLRRGVDTQRDDMVNCAALSAFRDFAADCPIAASLPEKSIELPNNIHMGKGDLDRVAAAVREAAGEVARGTGPASPDRAA